METMNVRTSSRTELRDVTGDVAAAVRRANVKSGACVVTVPHTTAGVTVNENADPDVRADIESALERIAPWEAAYRHSEGNSAAHVKAALVGHSTILPVADGELVLGTWQGIYFCEFDGPRARKMHVLVLPSS